MCSDVMSGSTAQSLTRSILSLPLPSSPNFGDSVSSTCTSSSSPQLPQGAAYALLSADLSILTIACDLLEPHAYSDEAVQSALSSSFSSPAPSLLAGLLDFVEHASPLPAWAPLIQAERRRGHGQANVIGSALSNSSDEEGEEDESLEIEKTFAAVKAGVARIAIAVCSNDAVMEQVFDSSASSAIGSSLSSVAAVAGTADAGAPSGTSASDRLQADLGFAWVVQRAVGWLERSDRTDLVITGSTMLANLARSGGSKSEPRSGRLSVDEKRSS